MKKNARLNLNTAYRLLNETYRRVTSAVSLINYARAKPGLQ
jgi:hypothetical protein